MNNLGHRRLRLILTLSTLAFAVVVLRAIQIQGFDSASLTAKAEAQQSHLSDVQGVRGTIYDRNGLPLAQDQQAFTVMANQTLIKDQSGTAIAIAQAMGYSFPPLIPQPKQPFKKKKAQKERTAFLKYQNTKRTKKRKAYTAKVNELVKELTGSQQYAQVNAARQILPAVAKRITARHLVGISMTPQGIRYYPYMATAAQLVGFTDIDGNGANGSGIEQMENRVLASHPGEEAVVAAPGSGATLEHIVVKPPVNGHSVKLTIDKNIQEYTQRVIQQTQRQYGAHATSAIVMNPRTGAILAMASAPGYNNNDVHDLSSAAFARMTKNSAVQDAYEPGSVFKVITFSAALTNHVITPNTVFANLPNSFWAADKEITDAEPRGPKTFTASQILAESSNVGTDTIANMLGHHSVLQSWIHRYGLGKKTALDLPGESVGIVRPLSQWSGSSPGTIPIGQGVSVTAAQMANVYATIANGGVMPQPHVIESVSGHERTKLRTRRVLSPKVDHELVKMLEGVVDEPNGTGRLAQIPGYTVAGKTGTAEKPGGPNGYLRGKYVSSFVGFFPANNPQVEIMVVVDSPSNGLFGGTVAAPAFARIGCWYAHNYNVVPDKPGKAAPCTS